MRSKGRREGMTSGLAAVALVLILGSCGSTDVETVTVHDSVAAPVNQVHREPKTATNTSPSGYTQCDPNIQARTATTTCEFAQNTFWTYWTRGESPAIDVYSPAARSTFSTTCHSDGDEVTCTTPDRGVVKFPQSALDSYSSSQAETYAAGHDLGPDPYEPEYDAPSYDPEDTGDGAAPTGLPDRGNIPSYDNGNGYRVQCNDGMYSHSGGIQGACSGHGGVAP